MLLSVTAMPEWSNRGGFDKSSGPLNAYDEATRWFNAVIVCR